MASADTPMASGHSVSTAKFKVNVSQLPDIIKKKGKILLYSLGELK